jgi:hypothetical protein
MAEAVSNLMEANLLGVFNERDTQRRGTVGREALEAKATALQPQMEGLLFAKAGPVRTVRRVARIWRQAPYRWKCRAEQIRGLTGLRDDIFHPILRQGRRHHWDTGPCGGLSRLDVCMQVLRAHISET